MILLSLWLHNGVFVSERRIIAPTCQFPITRAPSADAVTSPLSTRCEVNPSRSRSWSPCWFDVISSEVVTVKFFWKGPESGWASQLVFTYASKPGAGCAIIRTYNVTCGAKHHWTHINTMKLMCAHAKKKPARHRPVTPILRASARAIPDVLCVLGHF